MEKTSAQALRQAVVNAAATNAAFRDELIKDGPKAVAAAFGDQGLKVRVQIEEPKDIAILIPQKTDTLARAMERIAADLGDRSPTRGEFDALVINRAWKDPAFLGQLRSDPHAAINSALKKYATSVPADAVVKLYEEQPGECLIVLAPLPADSELSDSELEAVAGGEGVALAIAGSIAGAVGGAIATKIIDKIWVAPSYPSFKGGGGRGLTS